MLMLKQVKLAIRAMLHRFDSEVCRYSKITRFMRLRILNENNTTVVLDVGANVGQYAKEPRATGYTGRIVSFEPLSEAFAETSQHTARDSAWECKQLALGSIEGE